MNAPSTILIPITFGIICFILAKAKKRNPGLWLLAGLLFNIFALIILAVLPDGDLEEEIYQLKTRLRMLENSRKDQGPPAVLLQKTKVEQTETSPTTPDSLLAIVGKNCD